MITPAARREYVGEATKSPAATLNLVRRHALNPARVEPVLTTLFRSDKVSCRFDMKEQHHIDAGPDGQMATS